eukprot:PLAT15627.1.p1 GENE.PLAT15627.1~~PLAT15627.1.p1  ORF type:complete len:695 (+),score=292.88 PLAT15627.1:225-2087(+)
MMVAHEVGSLKHALADLREYVLSVGEAQLLLAEQMAKKVVAPIKRLRSGNAAHTARLEATVTKIVKDVRAAEAALDKARLRLQRVTRDEEAARRKLARAGGGDARLVGKAERLHAEREVAAHNVSVCELTLSVSRSECGDTLEAIVQAFHHLDKERIDTLTRSLRHFTALERHSILRQHQELSSVSLSVEDVDSASDMRRFGYREKRAGEKLSTAAPPHVEACAMSLVQAIFDGGGSLPPYSPDDTPALDALLLPTPTSLDDDERASGRSGRAPSAAATADGEQAGEAAVAPAAAGAAAVHDAGGSAASRSSAARETASPSRPRFPATARELFSTASGRACFVRSLNLQRSRSTCVAEGAPLLVLCMLSALDACVEQDDIAAAKKIMIMSETFFTTEKRGERVYVQRQVRRHPIWQDIGFWEAALSSTVAEEKRKSPYIQQQREWSKLGKKEREDSIAWSKSMIFGQLGSFTVNMLAFGVSAADARVFVARNCERHYLSTEHSNMLMAQLEADAILQQAEQSEERHREAGSSDEESAEEDAAAGDGAAARAATPPPEDDGEERSGKEADDGDDAAHAAGSSGALPSPAPSLADSWEDVGKPVADVAAAPPLSAEAEGKEE